MKKTLFAVIATLLCVSLASAETNRIAAASTVFRQRPGFRTKEARILFPALTNGMHRADVKTLLGDPEWKGVLASSSNEWTYSVFYSTLLVVHFTNDCIVKTEAVGFEPEQRTGQQQGGGYSPPAARPSKLTP